MTEEKPEKYKWVDAVARLIELTRKEHLQWSVDTIAVTPFDEVRLTAVFTTEFDGRKLRLYGIKEGIDYSYMVQPFAQLVDPTIAERKRLLNAGLLPTFRKTVVLEIVTNKGETILTFPDVNALSDLLKTVEFQVAGMTSFLKNINRETEAVSTNQ